jgi:hypothetical protein
MLEHFQPVVLVPFPFHIAIDILIAGTDTDVPPVAAK